MATLTETAFYARAIIKYGSVGIVVLIVGRFLLVNAYELYVRLNPPPPSPPTVGFGILPDLVFPSVTADPLTYQLEMPTGRLPVFPVKLEVYQMQPPRANLLGLERARQDARELGFPAEPDQLSEILYRWRNFEPVVQTLDFNVAKFTFTMNVDWISRPEYLFEKNLPNDPQAIALVQRWLSRAQLWPNDFKDPERQITYLKASGNKLAPISSLSEADFVQVDLFRDKIAGQFLALPANPTQGIIRAIVSGNTRLTQIVNVQYHHFPINYDRAETYPLKTAQRAWEELQAGYGYIAQVDDGVSQVTIRRMTLAYFDDREPQQYLQPIIVFAGDDNFVAYVPAVAPPTQTTELQ